MDMVFFYFKSCVSMTSCLGGNIGFIWFLFFENCFQELFLKIRRTKNTKMLFFIVL